MKYGNILFMIKHTCFGTIIFDEYRHIDNLCYIFYNIKNIIKEGIIRKILLFVLIFIIPQILCANAIYKAPSDTFRVFIWDNDNGATYYDQILQANVGFETPIMQTLDNIGVLYSVSTSLPIDASILIDSFDAVIVTCGNRPSTDQMFSTGDRSVLLNYLDLGGRLYMEGTNLVEYMNPDTELREYMGVILGFAGNDSTEGNVACLMGYEGTIYEGINFNYAYQTSVDHQIDQVLPDSSLTGNSFSLFYSDTIQMKAYYSRANAYAEYDLDKNGSKTIHYKVIIQSILTGGITSQEGRNMIMDRALQYLGNIRVLVVNDSGDPTLSPVYAETLDSLEYRYDVVDVSPGNNGPSYYDMKNYTMVMWFTGNQTDNTITDIDKLNIEAYLDSTGRYFMLFGPSVASDIYNPLDNTFLNNYFGTQYVNEFGIGNPIKIKGDSTNVLLGFYANYNPYNIEDIISPVGNGWPLLRDAITDSICAITFQHPVNNFKTAYFSIGLERLSSPIKADSVQTTVVRSTAVGSFYLPNLSEEYFDFTYNSPQRPQLLTDESYIIVNGSTLYLSGDISNIEIYGIDGRLIKRYYNRRLIKLNLSSGVYYVKYGNNQIKKILILP